LRGARADSLARELSAVLDRRLPARLNVLSTRAEGSQYFPDRLDTDLVGTIDGRNGATDIVVQRVKWESGEVWLFSSETLEAIPDLYQEVNLVSLETKLPVFLTQRRLGPLPLFEWLLIFVGMPAIYLLAGLLDKLASPLVDRLRRRFHGPDLKHVHLAPRPVRLLLLAISIRWMAQNLGLSLLTRQLWTSAASVLTVTACVWVALLLSAWGERVARRRLEQRGIQGVVSLLRVVRRGFDLLAIFSGTLVVLSYFNLNVTAALAGLGVGGIAIALAAQKTLENVIGGISIIADRVVRVGDLLKIGTTVGTVEGIGLRSTRIRTMDRSIVSIPNGQISTERLEDMSLRDKFWFHPTLSLRYETTVAQMRTALESIRRLILDHARVEPDSVRVRFLGFGSSSLDVDVSAYIYALEFGDFLEIQEELLLRIMDAIQAAGTRMALPSQTTYVASETQETTVPETRQSMLRSRR
jgi:MscS family membrane protein